MAEAAKAKQPKRFAVFSRVAKYFREVKAEVKKVIWPNRKQVVNNTAVVILAIIIVGIVIGVLDVVFSSVVSLLIK
ncbi:MAG: preprotein translocase subunit SecE [Firmicutes bacterium]|nr:preprotein translocase subunit SecE [Bacillota bacterium]